MESFKSKVVWITGASSGLGRSLALIFAEGGATVIASARNEQALEQMSAQNDNIRPLAIDITDQEACAALPGRLASYALS